VNRRALVLVVTALVGVFAAIAISVVSARDTRDRDVERSFEAKLSQLESTAVGVDPVGCRKTRVNFYDCDVRLTIRGRPGSTAVRYRVWLEKEYSGCWTTTSRAPVPLPFVFRRPTGCLER
jgi:hypothetical protein